MENSLWIDGWYKVVDQDFKLTKAVSCKNKEVLGYF